MKILNKFRNIFISKKTIKKKQNLSFEQILKYEKEIIIVTTEYVLYIAYILYDELLKHGIRTTIISKEKIQKTKKLHIIISPNMFTDNDLPKNYIAFQVEQLGASQWFDTGYQKVLENSSMILDYSLHNISFLKQHLNGENIIHYYPISYFKNYTTFLRKHDFWDGKIKSKYDILFYGSINERRKKYLDILNEEFNIKIISGKFGNELYRELLSTKIVVNIHFYKNALVETTRIFECLSLGLTVVSEDGAENNITDANVYFVPEDDIQAMCSTLKSLIRTDPRQLT